MNTETHYYITRKGFDLLSEEVKKEWKSGKSIMLKSCMYPDIFADRGLTEAEKKKRDPDFKDSYLEPHNPKAMWYRELVKKVNNTPLALLSETVPELRIYVYEYYLNKTVEYLKKGDMDTSAIFAGVFSHYIGDTTQPIHLVNSRVIDLLVKCPVRFLGFELHAGIEGISGKPSINNYTPEILGNSLPKAVMGLYRKILLMAEECRYTTISMVKAIYSNKPMRAKKLAGISVKAATLVFADFLRTCWALAYGERISSSPLPLINYPFICSNIDMLYRYKPMKNISLIPYSGGRSYPLTTLDKNGKKKRVKGFGVIPYMGPLKTSTGTIKERDARIEFLLWPGGYHIFKAKVGLNPLFKKSKGKVVFRVFADNRIIARSKEFSYGETEEEVIAKIPENAHFLTLSMLTVKEPPSPIVETHPHGVWVEPLLE